MTTTPPDAVRASSFGSVAADYDAYRPPPPEALTATLGPLEGSDAVDVAAGTGLLSRFLAGHGARVTAVEPDTRMAEVLAVRSPGVTVVTGSAESVPLPAASADLVTVSSAWHWFDHDRAAAEFARLLRPAGRLVVLWNGLDYASAPWLAELRTRAGARGAVDPSRRRVELSADLPFTSTSTDVHRWSWSRTPDEVVGLLGTYSGILTGDPADRARLTGVVRDAIADHAVDGRLLLPMTCRTVRADRT